MLELTVVEEGSRGEVKSCLHSLSSAPINDRRETQIHNIIYYKINGIKYKQLLTFCRSKSQQEKYSFRRERSLEDINKDIETIWRELQEIDKITRTSTADTAR